MRKKIKKTEEALCDHPGSGKKVRTHRDPVDTLIRTILSQNTNDGLRDRAYVSLKKRFPTHDAIASADTAKIAEAIRTCGLSRQKSQTIKRALTRIKQEQGKISLAFLRPMATEDAISYLKSIKGIGDKTAAIIMLFCFGRKTFPVDTHIQRITKRMGLVPASSSPEKIRKTIEPHISEHLAASLHACLISLGKNVCRAANPSCSLCPLLSLCAFGKGGGLS